MSEEDKFNADALLPTEDTKGFFDDPNATNVRNGHLINIYRPVGVNTINTTNKNPSWDLRGGGPANPRNFVSPWNMSSIEPDPYNRVNGLCK